MAANPHFSELLLRFNEQEAEYLVVGGYALMKYSEPRFSIDWRGGDENRVAGAAAWPRHSAAVEQILGGGRSGSGFSA